MPSVGNGDGTARGVEPSVRNLLGAVNTASAAARNAWLAFLGIATYLFVTLAGISHKDLLLDAPTQLPFVNVEIPLTGFFLFAPAVLLFFHFGLLLQHWMLYKKLISFNKAFGQEDAAPTQPIRDEVHSYFFTQSLVGKLHERLMVVAFKIMMVLTFVLAPVFLFFYFQSKFLPFHSQGVTWVHRVFLLADVILLLTIGAFLFKIKGQAQPRNRPNALACAFMHWIWLPTGRAFHAVAGNGLRWVAASGLVKTIWAPIARWSGKALNFVNQFGGESVARVGGKAWNAITGSLSSLASTVSKWDGTWVFTRTTVFFLLIVSFFVATVPHGYVDELMNGAQSWTEPVPIYCTSNERPDDDGRRVFTLTAWLYEKKTIDPGGSRNRQRDPSELCQFVSWLGANRNLDVADLDLVPDNELVDGGAIYRLRGRDFRYANFSGADLKQVDFSGADLREASFDGSILKNSSLRRARLHGADLSLAELQGADLSSARLYGADLSFAGLQGATLRSAGLHGADLSYARLQGATLRSARLQGADLRYAELQGADLGRANIWKTRLSSETKVQLARFLMIKLRPPNAKERDAFAKQVKTLTELAKKMEVNKVAGRARVSQAAARLAAVNKEVFESDGGKPWTEVKDEFCLWHHYRKRPAPDPKKWASYLGDLACTDDTDEAYAAQKIAGRISGKDGYLRIDTPYFLERLESCPYVKNKIPAQVLKRLQTAAKRESSRKTAKPVKNAKKSALDSGPDDVEKICKGYIPPADNIQEPSSPSDNQTTTTQKSE